MIESHITFVFRKIKQRKSGYNNFLAAQITKIPNYTIVHVVHIARSKRYFHLRSIFVREIESFFIDRRSRSRERFVCFFNKSQWGDSDRLRARARAWLVHAHLRMRRREVREESHWPKRRCRIDWALSIESRSERTVDHRG